jgi:aryl-alcohol dehydrogenase-like predicted oxidoreductase
MEFVRIPDTGLRVSRLALGTWAIGGWMWGGTEERRSIDTILAAIDKGINLIDTAPVYGFGTSESIVGKAVQEYGDRHRVHLATKACLAWTQDEQIRRNGTRERIMQEAEDSLERLQTDHIDIYYVHWPDNLTPVAETARAMWELFEQGVVRAVGVSNFTQDQIRVFKDNCPLHVCQPPYNIFERGIEADIKPYCESQGIALMTYGALCRGLLSGRMTRDREFTGDDLRKMDPKFQAPRFDQYLAAAEELKALARDTYGKDLLPFSVRYVLEKGAQIAIWGGRRPEQMEPVADVFGWSMDLATLSKVDSILAEHVKDPVGAEFMAPPTGLEP